MLRSIAFFGILLAPLALSAQGAAPRLSPTPEQQELIRKLEHKLMAPCCYSQTIDVHMSQQAFDMRAEVESMVAAGKSEGEIIRYYKARYGETILVVPDGLSGFLAYAVPLLVTFLCVGFFGLVLRRMLHSAGIVSAVGSLPTLDQHPELIRRIRDELRDV